MDARTPQPAADLEVQAPDLTIVTVCIEKHYEYIHQQIALINALNPGTPWKMLVVDNSTTTSSNFAPDDPRCEVIPGLKLDEDLPDNYRGSYHHAAALNMALQRVTTRYALILDPDLFVLYWNWAAECLDHMRRHTLTFFGVPWHYRWYRKWRYYPCVHFLLIDLERIDRTQIDFTPGIVGTEQLSRIDQWLKNKRPLLYARRLIHSSRDTGWMLYRDFGHKRRYRADIVMPVIDFKTELQKPKHMRTSFGRWLEKHVPTRWRFLPVEGTYVDPANAVGFQHPAFKSLKPEKFVWRGAPFAFHLRRHVRDTVDKLGDQDRERVVLTPLLKSVAESRSWHQWERA